MAFLGIKSKQEKEMERKIAIRSTLNELNRCKKSMEKKKQEMLRLAGEARKNGLEREYQAARNGLMSMMKYSQTLDAVRMRVQIAETMRDMSSASMKAVKTMGLIGNDLSRMMEKTNFAKNQMAFEMGSMKMEEMMSQMEDMLESTSDMQGGGLESDGATDWGAEADRLIESAMSTQPGKVDQEIDSLLSGLSKQGSAQ